jgi:hypothetical protein
MENGRMRTGAGCVVVMAALTLTCAACAPMPYQAGRYPGPYAPVNPYAFRAPRPEAQAGPAVGRWDNVMLLPAGTPVQVLMMDGRKAGGNLTSADATILRIVTASGEVELAAIDVMRVDRLPEPASRQYGKAAAAGAAAGAGLAGVAGLIVGHMPPARIFAAGAIIGAGAALQDASYARGPVMIYLAGPRAPLPKAERQP